MRINMNIYIYLVMLITLYQGHILGIKTGKHDLPEDKFFEIRCRKDKKLLSAITKNKPIRWRVYWTYITVQTGFIIGILIVAIPWIFTGSLEFIDGNIYLFIYLMVYAIHTAFLEIYVKNHTKELEKNGSDFQSDISKVYSYKIPSTPFVYREIPVQAQAGDVYKVSLWVNMKCLEWELLSKYYGKNSPELPWTPEHCQLKVNTVYSNNRIVETAKVDADAFQFDWQCISDTFVLKNEQPQGVTIKALQIVLHFENSPYHTSVTDFSLTKVE